MNRGRSRELRRGHEEYQHAFGLGINGQPSGVWEVGRRRDLCQRPDQVLPDTGRRHDGEQRGAENAIGLPDTKFSETRYGVYAKYALSKQSDLRLDVSYIIEKLDEWSWGFNGIRGSTPTGPRSA
jgi:hypothetical protein